MIPCVPADMPWRQYDPIPYIPKLPGDVCWRTVWFHVGGIHDACGVYECMRSHRWKAVLYVWSVMIVAKFGIYWRLTDNRQNFRCPYCDYPADRFIPNFTFGVTLTVPPRQLGPWDGSLYSNMQGTYIPLSYFPHRLFPWE